MNPARCEVLREKFMKTFQLVSKWERHQSEEIVQKANEILWQLERVRRTLKGRKCHTPPFRLLPYEKTHPLLAMLRSESSYGGSL